MDSLTDLVRERAHDFCEYCRMPQAYDDLPFQLDHIVAKVHEGSDDPDNRAWACVPCNQYKGTNLSGIDPQTGNVVRLFHPRLQQWKRHFRWNGPILEGRTQIARATIQVLRINLEIRVELRRSLIELGVFPPENT